MKSALQQLTLMDASTHFTYGLVWLWLYSNWSYEYCNYIIINMVTFWSVLALVHPSCHQFDDYSDYW